MTERYTSNDLVWVSMRGSVSYGALGFMSGRIEDMINLDGLNGADLVLSVN